MRLVNIGSLKNLSLLVVLLIGGACQQKVEKVIIEKVSAPDAEPVRLQQWKIGQEVNLPSGWQLQEAGSLEMLNRLVEEGSNLQFLHFNPESGNQPLTSNWQYDDLEVKLKFVLPESGSFKIQFYQDYELILTGSASSKVSGTLSGPDTTLIPYQKTGRKALVWQTLKIKAKAPQEGEPLHIEEILLNDNLIHSGLDLPLNSENEQWQLVWIPVEGEFVVGQVDFSTPELRNQQASNQAVSLSPLDYQYYEGEWTKLPDFEALEPLKSGRVDLFDINRIKNRNSNYGITFQGTLNLAEAGELTFWLASDDGSRLFISDSLVIDHDGTHGPEQVPGKISLEAGQHPLNLEYFNGAGGAALQLFYQVGEREQKPLNSILKEKPRFTLRDDYTYNPKNEPLLQRGFVCYPQFQGDDSELKFTHTISVGDPEGIHYNYDMGSGSLLQVWRGDFINTQTMWLNRGADQTAIPLGQVLNPSHPVNWQILKGKESDWADSVIDVAAFKFLNYELDESQRPVFNYEWNGSEVTDRLLPNENGLVRKLTMDNPGGNLWLAIARGKEIIEVEEGLYQVDEPGYFLKINEVKGMKMVLREDGEQKELLASAGMLDFDAVVEYEIIF